MEEDFTGSFQKRWWRRKTRRGAEWVKGKLGTPERARPVQSQLRTARRRPITAPERTLLSNGSAVVESSPPPPGRRLPAGLCSVTPPRSPTRLQPPTTRLSSTTTALLLLSRSFIICRGSLKPTEDLFAEGPHVAVKSGGIHTGETAPGAPGWRKAQVCFQRFFLHFLAIQWRSARRK